MTAKEQIEEILRRVHILNERRDKVYEELMSRLKEWGFSLRISEVWKKAKVSIWKDILPWRLSL